MTSIKGVLFLRNVDGEMKWFNGDSGNEVKYEGEIENGEPNGIGNITYHIGIKYVGEWKDGKYNGQGIYTIASDGYSYIGEYRIGSLWNGTMKEKDGTIHYKVVNWKKIKQ